MTIEGSIAATPTSPGNQFSERQARGRGVRYRGEYGTDVALWGNLGDESLNRTNFVDFFLDFYKESDVYQTGGADEPHLWTLTQLTGVAGTFTTVDDTVEGLAILDVVGATDNHGVQVQYTDATGGGELLQPANSEIVAWESRGSMNLALDSDWFVGISNTDTTLVSATGTMVTANNFMGFLHASDATTVSLVQSGTLNANQVVVASSIPLWTPADASSTKRRLGLRVEDNDKMYWYVDGIQVGETRVGLAETGGTVVLFSEAMCSSFAVNNGSAAAAAITIDYVQHQCTRPPG
jgi:hypothetical protein